MSIVIRSLASSSSGNAVLIRAGEHLVLEDAGISCKRLSGLLQEAGTGLYELEALLLSHEHIDHTAGLAALLKKADVPVYCTPGTFEGLSHLSFFPRLKKENFRLIRPGEPFAAGGICFTAVPTSHDAEEPVAFLGEASGRRFGLITDLGKTTEAQAEAFRGLDALYLEANHDTKMLETGPYPYALKLRVAGEKGHLSNEAAGQFLCRLYHPGLKQVLLAHLSKENNYPPLAVAAVRGELLSKGLDIEERLVLAAAPPLGLSPAITID